MALSAPQARKAVAEALVAGEVEAVVMASEEGYPIDPDGLVDGKALGKAVRPFPERPMVHSNEKPEKPSCRRKLARPGPSAHNLAEIAATTEGEFQLMHHEALECFLNDRKGEALGVARDALLKASERGGPFEAVAIISYLPILLTLAPEDTARQAARRAGLLATGRPGCEYFVSYAHHYALQVEIRADDREAAYKEANACIKAALRSDKHCTWLATTWRYIGMLQALRGEKMEAVETWKRAAKVREIRQGMGE